MCSGIAIAFVPNIIGSAFDATAADPLGGMVPLVPWAGGSGMPDLLARFGLVLLWPLLPLLKHGPDPVTWLALGIVVALRPVVRQQLRRLLNRVTDAVACGRTMGGACRVG